MVRAFLPKAALLLVLILLVAAPIQAAGTRAAGSPPIDSAARAIFTQVWEFLTGVWARNGCDIDPNGRCVPRPNPAADLDNGCNIDPNGRCGH